MGRLFLVKPIGRLIAGKPPIFAATVKMSERYIDKGSADFSPILKAGVGVVGVIKKLTSLKILLNSSIIHRRTFWAFL